MKGRERLFTERKEWQSILDVKRIKKEMHVLDSLFSHSFLSLMLMLMLMSIHSVMDKFGSKTCKKCVLHWLSLSSWNNNGVDIYQEWLLTPGLVQTRVLNEKNKRRSWSLYHHHQSNKQCESQGALKVCLWTNSVVILTFYWIYNFLFRVFFG